MVWYLPPGRAGRAPQASRHSSRAELFEAGRGEEKVSAGVVVRLALVGNGAVGPGVGDGFRLVAGSGAERTTALFEQALTVVAKPTLPANWSSWRRLTKFGFSSGRSGRRASMDVTITI